MTRRGAGLVGLLLLVYLAANYTRVGWLYIITAGLVAVLLLSWAWPLLALRGLRVTRTLASQTGRPFSAGSVAPCEGEAVTIGLAFSGFRFPRVLLRILDPAAATQRPHVWFLPALAPDTELTRLLAWERRGVQELPPVTLETAAPFGLFRARRRMAAPATLTVYPRWYAAPDERGRAILHTDASSVPRSGSGGAFLGTREYRSGDPVRSVHWRSSLRRNRLVVKEFEDTAHPALTVVLDAARDRGDSPRSSLDDAVRLAAGALRWGLDHGLLVTLAGPDAPRTPVNWPRGMEYLARVEEDERSEVRTLLTGAPPTPALIVLSPSLEGEAARAVSAWRRAGSHVIVVALRGYDPAGERGSDDGDAGRVRCGPSSDLALVTALMIAALRQPAAVRRGARP